MPKLCQRTAVAATLVALVLALTLTTPRAAFADDHEIDH